ncbi:translation initiation factor IF-2-like [Felis catus]|uniref:translation initiation factor IF-2-like n=1 Tax=Felis catus TaxID=9685 RepID=UPI001D19E78D|nr:translation initiation factor IF-2-like [Felis catus]XP_044909062.1 translation initiation factor IF-2-like [Felis catus]
MDPGPQGHPDQVAYILTWEDLIRNPPAWMKPFLPSYPLSQSTLLPLKTSKDRASTQTPDPPTPVFPDESQRDSLLLDALSSPPYNPLLQPPPYNPPLAPALTPVAPTSPPASSSSSPSSPGPVAVRPGPEPRPRPRSPLAIPAPLLPCRGGSRRGRVARGAAPRGCVPRRRPAGRRGVARRCACGAPCRAVPWAVVGGGGCGSGAPLVSPPCPGRRPRRSGRGPLTRPDWDYETAPGRESLRIYRQALLAGLKGAGKRPTNLAKVRTIIQGKEESSNG